LLLPEGKTGEDLKRLKTFSKAKSFGDGEALSRKVLSPFFFYFVKG
jgi:hypothetical protein